MVQVVVAHLKVILNLGLRLEIVVQKMDVLHHVVLIVWELVQDHVLVIAESADPVVVQVVLDVPVVARDALVRAVMVHVLQHVQMVAVIVVVNLVEDRVQDLVINRACDN